MEKLAFLLMGPPAMVHPDVASALRAVTVSEMKRLGAHTVQVNVSDEALGHPFGVEPDSDAEQILAAVFAWVDTAEGSRVAAALPDPTPTEARWHGWLVCESEPRPNRAQPPGPDGRVPGFAQLAALSRPAHLSWGKWRRLWQGGHTAVALHTQATFRYVQNLVFRPLTAGAPGYAAIVEECFSMDAASDLHPYFDAIGDEARLARHMAAMSESSDRFMEGSAPLAWTIEWVH
ncbi:MAG: EthD domain-containing protein [Acidimicrobiales bacterium]|nr:EthD domain-containing protein [Acidimicrobiales bacterium]